MLVRVLKGHFNGYGTAYAKAAGDEYDHPNPKHLIARGKLEAVDGNDSESRGLSRVGPRTRATAKADGAKRADTSAKAGSGTNARRSTGKGATANRKAASFSSRRKATHAKAKG